MGHADVKTTMRYLHHKSHASDADLLDEAAQPRQLGARADECGGFVTRMVERRGVFPATSAFRETDPVLEDHWE